MPVVITADGSCQGTEPPNCAGMGPLDEGLTGIISPGTSNYGPDVDNSSNYKAAGAGGPQPGTRTFLCEGSLIRASGQAPRGGSAPCGSDFSDQAPHTREPQQDCLGVATSQTRIPPWGKRGPSLFGVQPGCSCLLPGDFFPGPGTFCRLCPKPVSHEDSSWAGF